MWLALPEQHRGVFLMPPGVAVPRELAGAVQLERHRPTGPGPVMVASFGDYLGVDPAPVIFVEHGAGQSYGDDNGCYSGGAGRDRTILFVVPSSRVALRNRRRYSSIPNAVVGCPKLDRWATRNMKVHIEQPTVAVSFHWDDATPDAPPERRSALPHYVDALVDVAWSFPGAIGHAHPRAMAQYAGVLDQAGFEVVSDFEEVMERADVYVCDNSSTLYEFASTDRPVVLLNAPWYRRKVKLGLRFWEHAGVGLQVDEPERLVETIGRALRDLPEVRTQRARTLDDVYAWRDGSASKRAANAIVRALSDRHQGETMPGTGNPFDPADADDPIAPAYVDARAGLTAPAHPPIPRLQAAGASPDVIAEAQETWSTFTEEERWQATDAMNALSNAELADYIATGPPQGSSGASEAVPEGTVEDVLAWVGDDPARASAALRFEHGREHVRKTLVEALEDVAK